MHEKRFNSQVEKLRSQKRLDAIELDKVIDIFLQDIEINSLLDVGIGTGLCAETFSKKGIKVSGLEPNKEFIKITLSHVPGITCKEGAAEEIPFEDEEFDALFYGHVFHELDDLNKGMQEAYRVSKKLAGILEWKYKEEKMGPPLNQRIKEEVIEELALKTGFKKVETIHLKKMVFYKLIK